MLQGGTLTSRTPAQPRSHRPKCTPLCPIPQHARNTPFWEVASVASSSWDTFIHLNRIRQVAQAGGLASSGKSGKAQEAGTRPSSPGLQLARLFYPPIKGTRSWSQKHMPWVGSQEPWGPVLALPSIAA